MKSVRLSSFAVDNLSTLKPTQRAAVTRALEKLRSNGIHSSGLATQMLPSRQGYVVNIGAGGRLTVIHEGGGNLLVDDVFAPIAQGVVKVASKSARFGKPVESKRTFDQPPAKSPVRKAAAGKPVATRAPAKKTAAKKAPAKKLAARSSAA